METKDGGPEFPMTLRDFFAGMALAGTMVDSPDCTWKLTQADNAARRCYAFADAMLRVRE